MRGRRSSTLRSVEGSLSTVAPMPGDVPKEARAEWNRVCSDLASRKLLTPVSLGAVASYCIARWQVSQCVAAIQRDGAFVRTKLGEPKPHPALGIMIRAQDMVARLAAELGLTPAARSRKALSGGDERNPDDGAPAGLDL